jgi:hypothetical protein
VSQAPDEGTGDRGEFVKKKKNGFGEMLIRALEEAVEHHEGRLAARVDRVEITTRNEVVKPRG